MLSQNRTKKDTEMVTRTYCSCPTTKGPQLRAGNSIPRRITTGMTARRAHTAVEKISITREPGTEVRQEKPHICRHCPGGIFSYQYQLRENTVATKKRNDTIRSPSTIRSLAARTNSRLSVAVEGQNV